MANSAPGREELHRRLHIVDADDLDSLIGGLGETGQRPWHAVIALALEDAAEKGFPRGADDHRMAEPNELIEMAQHEEIMGDGFPEAEPRIE